LATITPPSANSLSVIVLKLVSLFSIAIIVIHVSTLC
jgi:hypothetical protein